MTEQATLASHAEDILRTLDIQVRWIPVAAAVRRGLARAHSPTRGGGMTELLNVKYFLYDLDAQRSEGFAGLPESQQPSNLPGQRQCPTCRGTGINPVWQSKVCPKCNGERVVGPRRG